VRVYSYVVARDYGFAPNPFHGWCTLATCKPDIRKTAQAGDWIVGTGSATKGRAGRAVYAMRVEETLTFEQFWKDPRFLRKRPDLRASRKLAFGDNIYRPSRQGGWAQLASHHSLHDGRPNSKNVMRDTRIDRVLLARDFLYWGRSGPEIPPSLRAFGPQHEDLCMRWRGHKCRLSPGLIAATVGWLGSFDERGCLGRPGDWP
jgi:hypothetical protein